ncbi:MAG: hypothetical protein CVU87_05355 [Firmicutes bacterium HGW-Firmicutes-12]|jgi:DNA-binding HxlR family transcriptional regulator|nr:MAG: hypothetical protein CVU87_05355 [Firmicutes bacterium HGW-Firmicutes-12]
MEHYNIDEENPPILYTNSIIRGKWKVIIIYRLSKRMCMRYNELKRCITGITHKMLSNQLKELENDDIIIRKEYSQIPPKVEYSLTEKGKSLVPVLNAMCRWGRLNSPD